MNVGQDARVRKTLCLPPQQRMDRVRDQENGFKEPLLPSTLAEERISLSLPLSIPAEGGDIWRMGWSTFPSEVQHSSSVAGARGFASPGWDSWVIELGEEP